MSIDAGSIHSRLDIDIDPYMSGLDSADSRQQRFVREVNRRYPKLKADASPFEQSLEHANKLVDGLERNIVEANRAELRIDSKAFLQEISRAEDAVRVLELTMEETNNFELEVEVGKLKANVEKAKQAMQEYDDKVEEAKNKVLSVDVSEMEKSMASASRRLDAYVQSIDTASDQELSIRTSEYENAMSRVMNEIESYQAELQEVNQSDLTIDVAPMQRAVAVAKAQINDYNEMVDDASDEELRLQVLDVIQSLGKARDAVSKYKSDVEDAQRLEMHLDTADISTSLSQVRTDLASTRTSFQSTFNQAQSDVNNFVASGTRGFNEFGGVTGKFANVLRMDVADSVKTSALKLAEMERAVRSNAREFGSYSTQVQASRRAMTEYSLSLDDATFKSIYIDSRTQAHNRSIQQQADQLRMNARMMALMGDQTEITARRLDALVDAGATADDIFATPKTIGQVTLLNRMLENSNSSLVTMSNHTRRVWQNIDDQVKSWSINKMAIKEAKRATAGIADEQERLRAEARLTQQNIQVYTQQLAVWQTTALGLVAGSIMFYKKVFSTAMEHNAELREEFEVTKAKILKAFEPLLEVASEFASKILEVAGNLADWVAEFNEANPVLAEFISALGLILPAITLIMSPLMITGGLISGMKVAINGLNMLLGTLGASFTITGASMALVIGPAIAVAGAIAGIIVIMKQNEEALMDLQQKWGDFGKGLSAIMETIQGVVKLSIGNIIIMIKTLGEMLVAVFTGRWKEIPGIWKKGWAEVENNTAEAMANIQLKTTEAFDNLNTMTDSEMDTLKNIYEDGLPQLANLTEKNAKKMAKDWADAMADKEGKTIAMSQKVIDTAQGLNDTTAVIFDGIREGMTVEQATKKLEENFESMARSGEYSSSELESSVREALDLIEKNTESSGNEISKHADTMFQNFSTASQIGMDDAIIKVAGGLQNMKQTTVDGLSGMGETWQGAFDGLGDISSLSYEEIISILQTNYDKMGLDQETFLGNLEAEWGTFNSGLADTTSASMDTMTTVVGNMCTSLDEMFANTSDQGSIKMETLATNMLQSVSDMGVSGEDMRSLGDTFKTVFDGIELNGSMSSAEVRNKVTENLQGLNLTGAEILDLFKTEAEQSFEAITSSAEKESKKTKEQVDAETRLTKELGSMNYQGLAEDGDKYLKDFSKSAETETKKATESVDKNTKDAQDKGSKNTEKLAKDIDKNLKDGSKSADTESKKTKDSIDKNMTESARITEKEMKNINQTIKQNSTDMYNGVNTSFTKMSQVCRQASSDMYNGVKTSFDKLSSIGRQSSTDLYNGVSRSFEKLASQVRQHATNMYNGAKTSFESMSNSAKQSASNMYNGVTGSTSKMATRAISDWNRVKSAYRASVTANVYIKVHGLQQALNAINRVKNATRNSIQMSVNAKNSPRPEGVSTFSDLLRDSIDTMYSYRNAENVIEFKVTDKTKKDEKKKNEAKPIEMNVSFNIKEVNAQSEQDVHRFMEEVTDVLKRELKANGGA